MGIFQIAKSRENNVLDHGIISMIVSLWGGRSLSADKNKQRLIGTCGTMVC